MVQYRAMSDPAPPGAPPAIRTSVFIATSFDGFIARPNGDLDWLPGADGSELPEDHGYDAFIATVDVIVLGRGTYEKVLTFDRWYYKDMPVRVLTTRPLVIPDELAKTVATMSGPPAEILAALQREGFRHAYVDGGRTIQGFLRAGLIGRITLTRIPVLIGSGIPLFGALSIDISMRHVRTRVLGPGLVQSEYDLAPPPDPGPDLTSPE